MRPGDLYRNTRTGSIILVTSSHMVNLTAYPFVMGMRCDMAPDDNLGYPFTVPVYIADDQAWVQTMTLSPRLKDELEPIGRSLDTDAMTAVLTAMFRIMRQD